MSEKIATREAYGKALVELGAVNDKALWSWENRTRK